MAQTRQEREIPPVPDDFMKGWKDALTALESQSPFFRLKNMEYTNHKAVIVLNNKYSIRLSFDPDTKKVAWESTTQGFTLDLASAGWVPSRKLGSTKSGESCDTLVSPVFTVGNKQHTIVFKDMLSTGEHRVEISNIVTGTKK